MKEKIKSILEKIDVWVGEIRLDLTLHFIVSAGLVWIGMLVAGFAGCDGKKSVLIGLVFALLIGVAKETLIDAWIKGSQPDDKDVAADVCGAMFGAGLVMTGMLLW